MVVKNMGFGHNAHVTSGTLVHLSESALAL